MESRVRIGGQALATFFVVASLYAGPLVLSAVFGLVDDFDQAGDSWISARDDAREAVFWAPPAPAEEPAVDGPEVLETEAVEAADPEVPTPDVPAPEAVAPTPAADSLASAAGEGPARAAIPETEDPVPSAAEGHLRVKAVAAGARRTSRRPAVKRPPLSAKKQRERERRKRRRERMAERKQCAELIDQLVPVEDDSWWVGRELINCYRVHPQQFVNMGGAWWNEVKGRKRGVKIYVSSRSRGDVARAAGFKKDDIVHSINGVPIRSDFTGALAATQLLRGHGRVKVERDGEKRVLKYKVVTLRKLEEKRLELASLADGGSEEGPSRR